VIIAALRDIAIIFLALESIVTLTLLSILIWQIWRLIKMLQNEVLPVLRDAQDTVATVKGTTSFMSDNLVDPVLSANSKVSGMRRTVQVLMADLPLQPKQKGGAPYTPPRAPSSAQPAAPATPPPAPPVGNGNPAPPAP
jgi:hypothetical protein